MTKFIMMVGLPGSGKSSWAEAQGTKVFSSDTMREEYYGDASFQGDNNLIFELLHKRIIENLEAGNDSIFDATNLNSKKRRLFLNKIADLDVEKIAVVVAKPIEQCIENDALRKRHVPEYVINRMRTQFQMPMLQEGFDEIKLWFDGCKWYEEYDTDKLISKACEFDQKNSHHSLSLGRHMIRTFQSLAKVSSDELAIAGMLHDIGKMKTQSFKEEHTDAHYYEHHNVSAYDAMFALKQDDVENESILEICQYITWHMYPYAIKLEKTKNRFIDFVGQEFYDNLMILHEADKNAH